MWTLVNHAVRSLSHWGGKKQNWFILPGMIAFMLLQACNPSSLRIAETPSSTINQQTPLPEISLQGSPTPVVLMTENANPNPQLPPTATPLPDFTPLVFTFPTVEFESLSLWRPPLYPVPWEPTPYDHFYLSRPIGANEINWPLANYRYGGVFFENTVHTGIDIPAPKGTPVLAAGPGEVIWAGWGLYFLREEYRDPYGLAVAIKHDFGYKGQAVYTIYGHMDEMKAWRGQRVQTGDLIGFVGETGKVTGPHLHFEVRLGTNEYSKSRNPELWIAPPQGWGVLAARILNERGGFLEKQTVNLRHITLNRYWYVITYGGEGSTNPDDYYQENMVIGDLPAGMYDVWISYGGKIHDQEIEIKPGLVTFFTFHAKKGFFLNPPETPGPIFPTPASILFAPTEAALTTNP